MGAKLKLPLLFNTPPDEKPLTLDEMDGWAARAAGKIDAITDVRHAATGNPDGTGKLPWEVCRKTLTDRYGGDDFKTARALLLKERQQ
jgi:hypothetical protein